MRILMAASCSGDRNLGVPGVMHSLADAFRCMGHRVDTMFRERPGRVGEILFGFRLASFACQGGFDVVDSHAVEAWPLVARRRRPAVVARSHGLELSGHRRLLAARSEGKAAVSPIYWTYRGSIRPWAERRAILGAEASFLLNRSDLDICLREFRADPSRLHLVRNGYPPAFLERPILRTPNPGILFLGSWIERKGCDIFALAARRILQAEPEARFVVAGTGVPEGQVLAELPAEVVDRVSVVPGFMREELPRIAAGCSILLFPSRAEGAPLSLVESMSLGLAPVASSIPGVIEIVRDGVNGRLVPVGDASSLAEKAIDLLKDPPILHRMRQAARESVLELAWDRIALSQISLLEQAALLRTGCG